MLQGEKKTSRELNIPNFLRRYSEIPLFLPSAVTGVNTCLFQNEDTGLDLTNHTKHKEFVEEDLSLLFLLQHPLGTSKKTTGQGMDTLRDKNATQHGGLWMTEGEIISPIFCATSIQHFVWKGGPTQPAATLFRGHMRPLWEGLCLPALCICISQDSNQACDKNTALLPTKTNHLASGTY